MPNNKFFFSDWSGVISDDRVPVYEANMRVLENHGHPRMSFEAWIAGSAPSPREFFKDLGLTDDPNVLFQEYTNEFDALRATGVRPVAYSDAQWFLQTVSESRPITVISMHPEENLLQEARGYGVESYVSEFLGSVKNKAQEMLQKISAIGVPASEVAYIGDTVFDVRSAKEAGVVSIAVSTGYHSRDRLRAEHPDILVDSLTEVLGYFS